VRWRGNKRPVRMDDATYLWHEAGEAVGPRSVWGRGWDASCQDNQDGTNGHDAGRPPERAPTARHRWQAIELKRRG